MVKLINGAIVRPDLSDTPSKYVVTENLLQFLLLLLPFVLCYINICALYDANVYNSH